MTSTLRLSLTHSRQLSVSLLDLDYCGGGNHNNIQCLPFKHKAHVSLPVANGSSAFTPHQSTKGDTVVRLWSKAHNLKTKKGPKASLWWWQVKTFDWEPNFETPGASWLWWLLDTVGHSGCGATVSKKTLRGRDQKKTWSQLATFTPSTSGFPFSPKTSLSSWTLLCLTPHISCENPHPEEISPCKPVVELQTRCRLCNWQKRWY